MKYINPMVALIVAVLVGHSIVHAECSDKLLGVAPLSHEIPNVGREISELIAAELNFSGYLQAVEPQVVTGSLGHQDINIADLPKLLPEELTKLETGFDYLLIGEVLDFSISDRDQWLDLGDQFNDLSRLLGRGSEVAHVAIRIRLVDMASGQDIHTWQVEGFDSQEGLRMKRVTAGWSGSVDMNSTDFTETMIGHATQKLIGTLLLDLYSLFPLQGTVMGMSGDMAVINLGSNCGLEYGDELTTFRVEHITNQAGEVVWESKVRTGSIQIKEFQSDRSLCLILDGAFTLSEGDIVVPLVTRLTLPAAAETDQATL